MADLLYDESDPWGWYFAALDNKALIGSPELPVHEQPPGNGYFRVRRKGSPWEPVQIWVDDSGAFNALRSGKPVKVDLIFNLWQYACRNPITEEQYDRALAGESFEDEPEPAMGETSAPEDPFVALSQEFGKENAAYLEFKKTPVDTQARADQAAIIAKRLAAISTRATARHKVEKEPSLIEGRRIDQKWRALREDSDLAAKALKRSIDAFLREEERKEDERRRLAAVEAARLKEIADEKLWRAEGANDPDVVADAGAALSKAKLAEREAEARPIQAGRTGERVTLRTFVSAVIEDQDALYQAVKHDARVKEILQVIADAAARANVPLPGTVRHEEKRAV
jgi:hypothetical protein